MLNNIENWSPLGVPLVIIKALLEQNFCSPTMIQTLSIPPAIFDHRDILGAAETGSGKTLAFGIPIINGILELKKQKESLKGKLKKINISDITSYKSTDKDYNDDFNSEEKLNYLMKNSDNLIKNSKAKFNYESISLKPLYAIILTPTRELAYQIKNHLSKAAKFTDIKIAVLVGGLAAVKQERILSKGPEIIIATPGRLWELIFDGNPHLSKIRTIRYLVIDETDRMMEKGHFLELQKIIEIINSKKSEVIRQIFVFSATLTLVHNVSYYPQSKINKNTKQKILELLPAQKLQKVIEMLKMKHPKIIDITKTTGTAKNLTECRIVCNIDHKDYYLYYFLKRHPGRTLIFCNSIGCVKRLATLFGILNCSPLPLHASMPQRQRLKNLERFQNDYYGLLIATDVAARGLDIPCIDHVIHYQVPRTSESYIHRSGRTARAQKEGITILIMEPSETHFYTRLCKTLNRTEDLPNFPIIDSLLVDIKEIVNIAREIDKFELQYRRKNYQKGWLHKIANEMDVLIDDEQFENTIGIEGMTNVKRLLKVKRNHLSNLIRKSFFSNSYSKNCNTFLTINENSQKAIDLMKQVINENPKSSKRLLSICSRKNIVKKKKKIA
ncbi:PREDICTED: ATP-dependent RNA helicase DDX24 [Ceratosolen solmsi marchali]|uniref:ATP-dependent RNA helicase n=1 Tax=Ceratosolen solmsi marchali TaxID=326594 RepID=A0AAJ7DZP4_9HYME|nr:PREDICTED: ATP-dependent RNA helicase DDX24 [Ceratosolen solmsi marchali]